MWVQSSSISYSPVISDSAITSRVLYTTRHVRGCWSYQISRQVGFRDSSYHSWWNHTVKRNEAFWCKSAGKMATLFWNARICDRFIPALYPFLNSFKWQSLFFYLSLRSSRRVPSVIMLTHSESNLYYLCKIKQSCEWLWMALKRNQTTQMVF